MWWGTVSVASPRVNHPAWAREQEKHQQTGGAQGRLWGQQAWSTHPARRGNEARAGSVEAEVVSQHLSAAW